MHYYNRHIGDYAKDTGHLSLLQHGAYTVLLDWSYASERPLPDDRETVYRICHARSAQERRAVDAVVAEFFPPTDGGRFNSRARREIAEWHAKKVKNVEAANTRWKSKRSADAERQQCERNAGALQTHCERNADAMQTHCEGSADALRPQCERNATRARVPLANSQEPIANNQEPAAEAAAAEIPSVAEVRTWAEMSGVCPDYAEHQHQKTTQDRTWLRAGRLADWRKRWLGFWLKDRENWLKNKSGAPTRGVGEPPPSNTNVKLTIDMMRAE
jgi:uncharacterized protein YdaU (DUF1376 family)